MTPKVIEAPIDEPVSVAEARAHVEARAYVDSDTDPIDDLMFEGWIAAAREHCENFLGLSLSTRVLEVAMDEFPTATTGGVAIDLPMGPVRQIISVSYGEGSDLVEMDPLDFTLDDYRLPSRLRPISTTWPAVTSASNTVKVRYLAGYGEDSDGGAPVPRAVRAAMLLIIGALYRNREDVVDAQMIALPVGAEALMRPLRIRLGMA